MTHYKIVLSGDKTSIEIDTNTESPYISYSDVDTTDHYRKGTPYKLFHKPGKSAATITFTIENQNIASVSLTLNHCRTSCHAKIDILVNKKPFLQGYQEARWEDFGIQTFSLPCDLLKSGENKIIVVLNSRSEGVYWLSDLRLDILYK